MKLHKRSKLVYGAGINDADYNVCLTSNLNGKSVITWVCPFYAAWASMIRRCYCQKFKERQPAYSDCVSCSDWLRFSNFRMWASGMCIAGKELDKDILVLGNTVYCPDRCVFVDSMTNTFINEHSRSRGQFMIGVDLQKSIMKFRSRCHNPFTGKSEYLGAFKNEIDAHLAWKKRKLELAIMLAERQTDKRVAEAIINRYL